MARYEIAGAANNVASIYKNTAPIGSIEGEARLNVGKIQAAKQFSRSNIQCNGLQD